MIFQHYLGCSELQHSFGIKYSHYIPVGDQELSHHYLPVNHSLNAVTMREHIYLMGSYPMGSYHMGKLHYIGVNKSEGTTFT